MKSGFFGRLCAICTLCLPLLLAAVETVSPVDVRVVRSERGSAVLRGSVVELRGVNAGVALEYRFASGVAVEALDLTTLGNGHLYLREVEVSGDGKNWRPLLGRRINLPSAKKGGSERIMLPPSSIGNYWRIHLDAGVFFDAAKPVGLSALAFRGRVNVPERHLLVWYDQFDHYVRNMDYLVNDLGVTDVWMSSIATACTQSQFNQGFDALRESGVIPELKKNGIRFWVDEHESANNMFTPEHLTDELAWNTFYRQVRTLYAEYARLGFSGVLFDAEDYIPLPKHLKDKYEKELNFADVVSTWSFLEEFGYDKAYYRRGLKFGRIFKEVWPDGKFIQLYEARMYVGKPNCRDGNYWWLQGIADAGVEIWIATEKTYGAGNREVSGSLDHLHHWFERMETFIPRAYKAFPMASRIIPGFHPWNSRLKQPNYLPEYLDEQMTVAQNMAPAVWIYCEGNREMGDPRKVLDPELCRKFKVTPEQYLDVFRKHPAR